MIIRFTLYNIVLLLEFLSFCSAFLYSNILLYKKENISSVSQAIEIFLTTNISSEKNYLTLIFDENKILSKIINFLHNIYFKFIMKYKIYNR